jgi:hypothetical protein
MSHIPEQPGCTFGSEGGRGPAEQLLVCGSRKRERKGILEQSGRGASFSKPTRGTLEQLGEDAFCSKQSLQGDYWSTYAQGDYNPTYPQSDDNLTLYTSPMNQISFERDQ